MAFAYQYATKNWYKISQRFVSDTATKSNKGFKVWKDTNEEGASERLTLTHINIYRQLATAAGWPEK